MAPAPSRFPASTVPPCASAMARAMARPSPAPPADRDREASTRLKASNACGRNEEANPSPVSERVVNQVAEGLPNAVGVDARVDPLPHRGVQLDSERIGPAGETLGRIA